MRDHVIAGRRAARARPDHARAAHRARQRRASAVPERSWRLWSEPVVAATGGRRTERDGRRAGRGAAAPEPWPQPQPRSHPRPGLRGAPAARCRSSRAAPATTVLPAARRQRRCDSRGGCRAARPDAQHAGGSASTARASSSSCRHRVNLASSAASCSASRNSCASSRSRRDPDLHRHVEQAPRREDFDSAGVDRYSALAAVTPGRWPRPPPTSAACSGLLEKPDTEGRTC